MINIYDESRILNFPMTCEYIPTISLISLAGSMIKASIAVANHSNKKV